MKISLDKPWKTILEQHFHEFGFSGPFYSRYRVYFMEEFIPLHGANMSYCYVIRCTKSRFEPSECALLGKPQYSFYYAQEIIRGRWPEAEPVIAQDAEWACLYAKHIIRGRFPEAEKLIANSPGSRTTYGFDILGLRNFEELNAWVAHMGAEIKDMEYYS